MGRKAEGEGEGRGVKGLREEEDGRSLGRGTAEGEMRRWEIQCRRPGGVFRISSDRDDQRIFLGLKFSIPDFLG